MADTLTPEQRRKNAQSNKSKDTKLELEVRRGLRARGLQRRYRIHGSKKIGSPDIYFPRLGVAIYVHGCFWHQHPGCPKAVEVDHGNDSAWKEKFRDNAERDKRNIKQAREAGYRVAVVWECVIEPRKKVSMKREPALDRLAKWVLTETQEEMLEIG